MNNKLEILPATPAHVPAILTMVKELAEFEKLSHLVKATESALHDALFGAKPVCECLLGFVEQKPIAFALFYHNFSTFLGRKGLYLEDLYVKPEMRSIGYGREMLVAVAKIAVARQCGRFEWAVLDWNENAINFYSGLGAEVLPDWRICRMTGSELEHLAR